MTAHIVISAGMRGVVVAIPELLHTINYGFIFDHGNLKFRSAFLFILREKLSGVSIQ